jgi:hypothetical protein
MGNDWLTLEVSKCMEVLLTTNIKRVETLYTTAYWVDSNQLRIDVKIERPNIPGVAASI